MKSQKFVTNLDFNKILTVLVVVFIVVYLISTLVHQYDFSDFKKVVDDINEGIKQDEILSFLEKRPNYYYQIEGESYCITKDELKGDVSDNYIDLIPSTFPSMEHLIITIGLLQSPWPKSSSITWCVPT